MAYTLKPEEVGVFAIGLILRLVRLVLVTRLPVISNTPLPNLRLLKVPY